MSKRVAIEEAVRELYPGMPDAQVLNFLHRNKSRFKTEDRELLKDELPAAVRVWAEGYWRYKYGATPEGEAGRAARRLRREEIERALAAYATTEMQ